jgi:hypothetical protein
LIERSLSLPMTLDAALALLRNQDGEHRFSVGVALDEGGVSTASLALAATRAFSEVLVRALAAAPLRLVGAIVPGAEGGATERVWRFAFAPGSSELEPDDAAALEKIARLLERDRSLRAVLRHELSESDVERADPRANPAPERCLELAERLRRRKSELGRARAEVAAETRALHAVGSDDAEAASESLRALERESAACERALDGVLEILRADSARARQKRTRSICREIADLRLAAAQRALTARMLPSELDRVELRAARFEVVTGGEGEVVIEVRGR